MLSLCDSSDSMVGFSEFLDFNCYPYQRIDLWDNEVDYYRLLPNMVNNSGHVLVINEQVLQNLFQYDQKNLLCFLEKNYIWIWIDLDGFVITRTVVMEHVIKALDLIVLTGHLTIVYDAEPSYGHWTTLLHNVQTRQFPITYFMGGMSRVKHTCKLVNPNRKDFLLTTVQKKMSPHRTVLRNQLYARPVLADRGIIHFHRKQGAWIGDTSHQHTWNDGHLSMDLYSNAWTEIVPETLYRDGYFFTEKTLKPIVTKTPFFMVSTCGYLNYLHRLGFQTFGTLINEQYDLENRVQDRVKLMLDQLEDVVNNGTEDYVRACRPIVEHNYQRMSEIAGSWRHQLDEFYMRCLDEIQAFDH